MTSDQLNIHLGGTARSPEDVERLHAMGLQFAEIPITKPGDFSDLVDVYKELKERLGLYYICHGPREGNPNDRSTLEKAYLPRIFHILPLMARLGSRLLTIHLWLDQRFVNQEVIRFKTGMLKRIIHRANEHQITICLENLSEHVSDMDLPFSELPSLYLTLDLGHAQLLTGNNTSYEFLDRYPERIKHIHLHDNRGGDSSLDDLHLPPGEGVIEFDRIFKVLKRIGYVRTITLELRPHEIERSLGFVKKLIYQSV